MRSQPEIDAEIAALEACKNYIPKRSYFGDDNIAKVDQHIDALRGEIDITADEFNDFDEEEQSHIMQAIDWMNGDTDEKPSEGWDMYKPKGGKS